MPWFGWLESKQVKPVAPAVAPMAPPPVAPPVERPSLFYCDNDNCSKAIDGVDVKEIRYGCVSCKPDALYTYEDLSPESQKRFQRDPASLSESRVACAEHHLPLVARCPDCLKPLDRESGSPPIGIWGVGSSGKTVFCAAMFMEIEKKLFSMCGINPRFGMDLRGYRKQVVRPLWDQGVVPAKTQPGEHRGLVILLKQPGQRVARKFKMTDMDGAYYTEFFTSSGELIDAHRFTRLIHFTREAMFLISPDQAGAVGAPAQSDLYPIMRPLVELWERQGLLGGFDVNRLQTLVNAASRKLREHQYPSHDPNDMGYEQLAQDLLELFGLRNLQRTAETDMLLRNVASMTSGAEVLTMADQLSGLEKQLRDWNFPTTLEGKLDLRLALIVTKADLLMQRDPVLTNAGDMTPVVSNPANRGEWRSAVRDASRKARSVVRHYDPQVVNLAENSFKDVGYFFSSALGRETELVAARRIPTHHAGNSDSEETGPVDDENESRFEVRKRIPLGRDGTRRPEPFGVINPLLWVLMGE